MTREEIVKIIRRMADSIEVSPEFQVGTGMTVVCEAGIIIRVETGYQHKNGGLFSFPEVKP